MPAEGVERSPVDPPDRAVRPEAGALASCPGCGGALYGWTTVRAADAQRGDTFILDRCERCGLGIVREGELDVDGLVAGGRLRSDGSRIVALPNRRSLQAAIGERRWAGLRVPDLPFVATPGAASAMLERRGHRVSRISQPVIGQNQIWMWQTLMNAFTLHPNFAREAVAGRLRPRRGRGRIAFALDALVSVLGGPLVALVSLPLETMAALLRRGGQIVAVVAPAQSSSSTSSASSGAESV